MNKVIVYIAGKVKDLPVDAVIEKFKRAKEAIKFKDAIPYSPVELIALNNAFRETVGMPILSDDKPEDRDKIMKLCIKALAGCDAIYLCHDWQDSKGATIEKQVADLLNIPVFNA